MSDKSSSPDLLEAAPILECQNILGEGPLWHPVHQMLYWVDIESRLIHAWEPHTRRHRDWTVSARVGTLAPKADGKLLLGLHHKIAGFDVTTGEETKLTEIEADLPKNRCNDGKCDPAGRFWVGTMHLETKPGTGSLYCLDQGMKLHKVLTGLTISNGMGWSPDGMLMYFIDSREKKVRQYRFDGNRVALKDETYILEFDETPDGMCVDAEGMLWIGFYGGSRVGRYDPRSGRHLADVRVPAPHVTSCCFGGNDLNTLFITSARQGLTPEQLRKFPLSGSLFSCHPGVTGLPPTNFGLNGG